MFYPKNQGVIFVLTMKVLIFLGCLFFSTFSAGIFWILQTVHYPAYRRVGPKDFNDYFQLQQKAENYFTWIPPILATLFAIAMLFFRLWRLDEAFVFGLVVLTLICLIGSAALIIPQMRILGQHGYSYVVIKKLKALHWFRTLGWTLCSLYLFWLLFQIMVSPAS
jgi:hypothetical protein